MTERRTNYQIMTPVSPQVWTTDDETAVLIRIGLNTLTFFPKDGMTARDIEEALAEPARSRVIREMEREANEHR